MQDIIANRNRDIGSYWFPIFATNSMTLPSPINFLKSYPISMVYFTKAGLPIYTGYDYTRYTERVPTNARSSQMATKAQNVIARV